MKKRYAKPMTEAELAAIEDKDIDFGDIPELDDAFFRNARLLAPSPSGTAPVTMRLDVEVLDWFKARGKGHLTRMQSVLKAYVETQRERTRRSGRRKTASR